MNSFDNLLAQHVLLPSQYYDSRRRSPTDNALHRLMLAVLADALECLSDRGPVKGIGGKRAARMEAERWVEDDNDDHPFSFISICEALRIDAPALRKALSPWSASGRRLKRRAPVTQVTIKPRALAADRARWRKRGGGSFPQQDLEASALQPADRSSLR
jgi:hypothetical protein